MNPDTLLDLISLSDWKSSAELFDDQLQHEWLFVQYFS